MPRVEVLIREGSRSSTHCRPALHLGLCCGKQKEVKGPSLDISHRGSLHPQGPVDSCCHAGNSSSLGEEGDTGNQRREET